MPRTAIALFLIIACGGDPALTSSFTAVAGPEAGGSTTGPDSGTTDEGPDPSTSSAGTSSTGASSSGTSSTSDGSSTTAAPPFPDLGSPLPAGCQGKIDFLFVLSNSFSMDAEEQGKYLEALPTFITTIGDKFGSFDSHVMVVDTSVANMCAMCCTCDGVPQSVYEIPLEDCDIGIGNGVTLTLGVGAANKRCTFAGGHRYITAAEPDPMGAFLCAAQGGFSGSAPRQATAMVNALEYYNNLNGCNAGFLREDALLVVTVVSDVEDGYSAGDPEEWRERLVKAKRGDPEAIVFLVVTNLDDPIDRLQTLAKSLPHAAWETSFAPSWIPFFGSAVDLVADACEAYIPQ